MELATLASLRLPITIILFSISDPQQLDAAITAAMQSDEPAFIEVPTKSEVEEVPPVYAWQAALREKSS
jgi:thiamine pyrophosphate-dependent acetolactate synthase large subunit-like protein